MKAKIYYYYDVKEYSDDINDEIIIEADTIEELRQKCDEELKKRGAIYSGSEIIEE